MSKYFQAPWSAKEVVLITTISILASLLVFGSMELLGLGEIIQKSEHRNLLMLWSFFLQWLIIFTPLLLITIKKYKKLKAKYFGFQHIGTWQTIKLVIEAFLTFLGISIIITTFILITNTKIPGYQVQERIIPLFADNTITLIITGIVVVGIAPFIEEIFFRGFMLRGLVNKLGIYNGSIATAAIFAIFHFQFQSIIPLFILGIVINAIVIKGKSIWPAIAFHMINNGIYFTIEVLIIKDIISLESIV